MSHIVDSINSQQRRMVVKAHNQEEVINLLPIMSDHQPLRKASSDVTHELTKLGKELETIIELEDEEAIQQVDCGCCGLKEECTKPYISRIRNSYSGIWVCGLCSEAVKERLNRGGSLAVEEAVVTHKKFVQEFNSTTRLNPKLSLTSAMRNIAKRSYEKRRNLSGGMKTIMRSSSCVPSFNVD